jgi:hypothetical protein
MVICTSILMTTAPDNIIIRRLQAYEGLAYRIKIHRYILTEEERR